MDKLVQELKDFDIYWGVQTKKQEVKLNPGKYHDRGKREWQGTMETEER